MAMSGRQVSNINGYRYGFNGKEKEGDAGSFDYDFGARMYDSRLARWLAIDPEFAKYHDLSPYAFVANTPLWAIDPDGNKLSFVGSKADIKELKKVLGYMKRNSPSFREIYRDLKKSPNIHEIWLPTPIDKSKMTRDEIHTYNKKLFALDEYEGLAKEPNRLVEEEAMKESNSNGTNAAVISKSAAKNQYLERNDLLNEETVSENDVNGVGEGSTLIFSVQGHMNNGSLYTLGENSGLSSLAHEFKHMHDIDKGIINRSPPNQTEKDYYSSVGLREIDEEKVSELRAVEFENKVSGEIAEERHETTTPRTEY